MSKQVDLSLFKNPEYHPGRSWLVRILWYVVNAVFLKSYLLPFSGVKRFLLRLFGAEIGKAVVIKPNINIKYPWRLHIGNNSWIGEEVWIDNLADVSIGESVCVSQGAYLLTGNHNYKTSDFKLMTGEITIENGAWIGAKSVVCPGVQVQSHAILSVASVATHHLKAYGIYQGNPAQKIKDRIIK